MIIYDQANRLQIDPYRLYELIAQAGTNESSQIIASRLALVMGHL